MDMRKLVGRNFARLRQEKGLTQEDVEARSGFSQQYISGLERGVGYLLGKVHGIGPQAHQWAEAMLHARGIEGTRVLQGLLSLTQRYPTETLEKACETALSHGVFHLRTLRTLMARQTPRQTTLPFLEDHPIIRPLADYAGVVAAALARKDACGVRLERHERTEACCGNAQHNGPEGIIPQGLVETLPSSGYPLSGCSPAEPDSVSPDASSVSTPTIVVHQKKENLFHE